MVWINYNKYSILDEIIERIINLINETSGLVNQLLEHISMKTVKIKNFLSDKAKVENWLSSEKKSIESNELAQMGYWFHKTDNGFGLVITDNLSGEFNVMGDGKITMSVEKCVGDILFTGLFTASNEKVFYSHYNNFKQKVLTSAS